MSGGHCHYVAGSGHRSLDILKVPPGSFRSSAWMLFLMALIHLFSALGHFLIPVLSKVVAQDIHYGNQACLPKPGVINSTLATCSEANSSLICISVIDVHGGSICTWDYTGLGLDYQLLAGPSFMVVFTVASILWGLAADKFDRVHLLVWSTVFFSTTLIFNAFANRFWHLVALRMLLAAGMAGIVPIVPGIIFDSFSERHRALAMGFFHWGIYLGGGFANAVGKGITDLNLFGQRWRGTFVFSGIPGLILAFLMLLTGKDPPRVLTELDYRNRKTSASAKPKNLHLSVPQTDIHLSTEESETDEDTVVEYEAHEGQVLIDDGKEHGIPIKIPMPSLWGCCLQPAVLFLGLGACIRQAAGYTWGYNAPLYFQSYYPDFNASWWLTWITIFGGTIGVVFGGFVSDKLVTLYGLSVRVLVLASSQLIAAPFALGTLWLDPPFAFGSLLLGYFFSEMWYGVVFAIFVELMPSSMRSVGLALAMFVINNAGGNLPVFITPLSSLLSYRGALMFMYPGLLISSSFIFLLGYLSLRRS